MPSYNSPGVSVIESVNPAIAPLLANPSVVAIVGPARGEQTASERLTVQEVTTTSVGSHSLPVTTLNVTSTADFESAGTLYVDGLHTITYTGKTATSFTGASGGTGTLDASSEVAQRPRTTLVNTGLQESSVVVKLVTSSEVINAGNYDAVAGTDPDTSVSGDEPWTFQARFVPRSAPSLSAGTGTLTGTYVYAIAFVNADGETGIGPTSDSFSPSNEGIDIADIPIGPTGTTARNVYRKRTSGNTDGKFHLVATIANNTATTLADENTTDLTAEGDQVTTFGTAQPKTGLSRNDLIIITYDFTDDAYYAPTRFSNLTALFEKYGDPFDANGNINSPLSFASRMAFLNGASEVVGQAATADTDVAIENALENLESDLSVRIVVATRGTAATAAAVNSHVTSMNNSGYYRIGIVGRDGSSTIVSADTLRDASRAINYEAIQHVNLSSLVMQNPVTGANLNVGGQYAAASLAGMWAARDVQYPLTKKPVAGFIGFNDKRTPTDQVLDSAAGLLVIENQGGILQIRHSITTAPTDIKTREGSVVRAKYDMAHRIRTTLEGSIIGVVTSPSVAPILVSGTVSGVLDQLVVEGVISEYSGVAARVLESDPTTVEVRFQYKPAWPVNNIIVIFTIDTTSGTTTIQA